MSRFYIFLFSSLLLVSISYAAVPLSLLTKDDELPSLAPMLVGVQPAIVNISTTTHVRSQDNPLLQNPLFRDPFFRRFYNIPDQSQTPSRPQIGQASGVIVDAKNGYVITNHHVVDKADKITVTTQDGRKLDAVLVGSDAPSDIAVIKIPNENLTEIKLGVSEKLRVGDFVVAIGSPFGLSQTVTSGIISALGRSELGIEGYEDFIQTDAAINPGNSGGALINLRGELIGINTAILSRGGGSVGVGLSIPVDMVKSLMSQLLEHGTVKRGLLGVAMQDLTPTLAESFGISGKKGALITQIIAGSAAEDKGIAVGDVIVKLNDTRIERSADLRNAVGLLRPGASAAIEYYRDSVLKRVTVYIKEREEAVERLDEGNATELDLDLGMMKRLHGARFRNVVPAQGADKDENKDMNMDLLGKHFDGGVQVVDIDRNSPAISTGLRKNDIIVNINQQNIVSIKQLKQALKKASDVLVVKLIRDARLLLLVIR